MSLKITIEVDGPSEQQLAPVLGRRLAQMNAAPQLPTPTDLAHENAAALHQTIRELALHNQQLQAFAQQRLAPSAAPQQPVRDPVHTPMRPLLPHRYQPSRAQLVLHLLKQKATVPLRWLWTRKGWALVFIAMSAGVYATVMAAPKVADFLWPIPEFVEGKSEGPGAVEPASKPEAAPTSAKQPDTPDNPASKAGSNPPPPAAFRAQP